MPDLTRNGPIRTACDGAGALRPWRLSTEAARSWLTLFQLSPKLVIAAPQRRWSSLVIQARQAGHSVIDQVGRICKLKFGARSLRMPENGMPMPQMGTLPGRAGEP